MEKDGGVEVLKCFVTAQRPDNFQLPTSVKLLGVVTLFQYYLYKEYGNLKGIEKSDDIQCFYLIRPSSIVLDFFTQFDFLHLTTEFDISLFDSDDDDDDDRCDDHHCPHHRNLDIVDMMDQERSNNAENDNPCDDDHVVDNEGYDEVDMVDGGYQRRQQQLNNNNGDNDDEDMQN